MRVWWVALVGMSAACLSGRGRADDAFQHHDYAVAAAAYDALLQTAPGDATLRERRNTSRDYLVRMRVLELRRARPPALTELGAVLALRRGWAEPLGLEATQALDGAVRTASQAITAELRARVARDQLFAAEDPACGLLCSAVMKQIADALELLTAQHEDIAATLATLPALDNAALANALGDLADRAATHLAVEEQFLRTLGLTIPLVEHASLRSALTELFATEIDSPAMPGRLRAFETRWAAHTATQEQHIFIALAETLDPGVLADLGVQLGTWSEQSRCVAA